MNNSIIGSKHKAKVQRLQDEFQKLLAERKESGETGTGVTWLSSTNSNTTRGKKYKAHCTKINASGFNEIISIDKERSSVTVEPLVTMEALISVLHPLGLTIPVVPEFKGITVGGAIMGIAGESSSFKWGCFHDCCKFVEILCGNGKVVTASAEENSDLFHGVPGSYGSLGLLLSAEVQTIPLHKDVCLKTYSFSNPLHAIEHIQKTCSCSEPPEFLDGIIFSTNHACVMEGRFESNEGGFPEVSFQKSSSDWYAFHVQKTAPSEERMQLREYLFRYDRGCFWIGAYLLRMPILLHYLRQRFGRLNAKSDLHQYHTVTSPNSIKRLLANPWMPSKVLYSLLRGSEKWVQERFIIQDFCIPEDHAAHFYNHVIERPAIFPIWLCPIKGKSNRQLFAPHRLPPWQSSPYFLNFGIYGIPGIRQPTYQLLQELERLPARKVLYSASTYTDDEFWQIYPKSEYEALRQKYAAEGIWLPITEKVLRFD